MATAQERLEMLKALKRQLESHDIEITDSSRHSLAVSNAVACVLNIMIDEARAKMPSGQ